MRFPTKLFVFAAALTGVLTVYKIGQAFRGDDHQRVVVRHVEAPEAPEAPEPPEPAEPAEPAEPVIAGTAVDVDKVTARALAAADAAVSAAMASSEAAGTAHGKTQIRILTTNRAAFLSLREDNLVAGLSDSLRQVVAIEMKKEMGKEHSGRVGQAIEEAVRNGVSKMMQKEITVPLSEIRDIDYKNNRIVIAYKHGKAPGMINLETIKSDGDRTLLQQFNEADARKFVAVVRSKIK